MEKLTDDLLVEILIRLPCKTAVTCKSVCKRFLSLISNRHFIERFICRHHMLLQQMKDDDREDEWSLIYLSRRKPLFLFLPTIHLPNFTFDFDAYRKIQFELSLSFLGPPFDPKPKPKPKPKRDRVIKGDFNPWMVSCSNGLILCKTSVSSTYYSVCNLLTKQWLRLPPLHINKSHYVVDGFICEPYYHVKGNSVTLSHSHRFRVVVIPHFSGARSEIHVVVYSSETGQWNTTLVSCSKPFVHSFAWAPAVAHGSRLYFQGIVNLLVYDPFNNDRQCYIFNYPSDSNSQIIAVASTNHIGVSCGNIRISDVYPTSNVNMVSVWELEEKDDSAFAWRLVHRTPRPPLKRRDSVRPGYGAADGLDFQVVVRAFHPYHGDVVFFQHGHRILFANLKTNQFRTIAYGDECLQTIRLDLPWWPTPLPFCNRILTINLKPV